MRTLVLLLFFAAPVALAQDVPTGLTVGAGYASGFPGGAVHTEARVRFDGGSGWGLEPSLSWTEGLDYTVPAVSGFYIGGCPEPCVSRVGGERAVAFGLALAYRTDVRGVEVHGGSFGQRVLPV